MTITYGSLFAGVGGFDLGLEAAGMECRWQVEWDKQCQRVLEHHWPGLDRRGDVSAVNGATLEPVDVITFGSPCQDLSTAGKRAGLDGGRSGLFFQATRIIQEMRNATESRFPRWAVWENVVGALSSNDGRDFGAVLDSLADVGAMVIEYAVLDARWFGVPQRRRRVFVVACLDPATAERCPDPLLPLAESVPRNLAPRGTARKNAPGYSSRGVAERSELGIDPRVDEQRATWWDGSDVAPCLDSSMLENQQRMPDKNRFPAVILPAGDIIGTLTTAFGPKNYANHQEIEAGSLIGYSDWETVADHVGTLAPGTHPGGADSHQVDANQLVLGVKGDSSTWTDADTSTTICARDSKDARVLIGVESPVYAKSKRAQTNEDDETWIPGEVAPTLTSFDNGDTRATVLAVTESESPTLFDQPWTGGAQQDQVIPIDGISPTLAHASDHHEGHHQPKVLSDSRVRRLTPVECERLMGWSDDHTRWGTDEKGKTVEIADSPRYRMIGNGVASPVAAWLGRQIVAVDPMQEISSEPIAVDLWNGLITGDVAATLGTSPAPKAGPGLIVPATLARVQGIAADIRSAAITGDFTQPLQTNGNNVNYMPTLIVPGSDGDSE
jgi:DNA-cytosine methyltransferase